MMRKLIGSTLNLILVFVILVSSLYLVSSIKTLEDPMHIPTVLGFTPLTVVSGSMSPGIETGDMVIIRNGNKGIKAGDVVTYRLGEVLVTHRVKQVSEAASSEVFVTQGDANTVPDYKVVEQGQIIGKYAFRIPFGGYIKASLRGLPGILIIVGLSFIILMAEVLKFTNNKVKEAEESLVE